MNRLRELRKEKRLTQQEIADYIGISQNNYSYWENDKVKIDNVSLKKLADYFNVSVDYILGRTDTPTPNTQLNIPENLQEARIAFYGGVEGLKQEDIDKVSEFVDFLKSKHMD